MTLAKLLDAGLHLPDVNYAVTSMEGVIRYI